VVGVFEAYIALFGAKIGIYVFVDWIISRIVKSLANPTDDGLDPLNTNITFNRMGNLIEDYSSATERLYLQSNRLARSFQEFKFS
jgi:hypothetical protein